MEITSRKHLATTCDELLNHDGWHEIAGSRFKKKGFGNRVFRTFELDCGGNYFIKVSEAVCAYMSLTSLKLSKPCRTIVFQTMYGQYSSRMTDIADCTNREQFYMKLYQTLNKRFPLTDFDVQTTKVM
jgi:hypothetical protein